MKSSTERPVEHKLGWLHGRLVEHADGLVQYFEPNSIAPTFQVRPSDVTAISAQQGGWTGMVLKFHGHGSVLVESKLAIKTAQLIEDWFKPRIKQSPTVSTASASSEPQSQFIEQLSALANLHREGSLTDEEFTVAKKKLLAL